MAKLERITNKIFGETATATGDNPEIGQFGSAKAGTYIGSTDINVLQSLPAYSNGWIDAVTPQNQFPPLPEMTAVHKILSYQSAYLHQMGISEYDANTTYYTNSFCQVDGVIYKSIADDNQGNDPTEQSSEYWIKYEFTINNRITNCILEAPNGIATYSGSSVTLKHGLKVLIPDGRDTDGALKNIEFTLQNDLTDTITSSLLEYRYVFLTNQGNIKHFRNHDIFYSKDIPTRDTSTNQLWFNEDENQWYNAEPGSAEWTKQYLVPVCFFYWNNTTISKFKEIQPINLLKQSDKTQVSGWSMPNNNTFTNLTLGSSGVQYTAPANGWVHIRKTSSASNQSLQLWIRDGVGPQIHSSATNQILSVYAPVKKGDVFGVSYTLGGTTLAFRFIYAEGEV